LVNQCAYDVRKSGEDFVKPLKLEESYRQVLVDQLSEFVRIPSRSSPRGGEEGDLQVLVAKRMAQYGARVRSFDAAQVSGFLTHPLCHGPDRVYKDRPTEIGEIGPEEGETLLILAHSDTVPVFQPEAWTVDPYSGIVRSGKVYGLGVSDDKWGLAVMLIIMQAMQASDMNINKRIIFASTIDEEHGVGNGLLQLMLAGIQADAAIYLDGTEMDICLGNLGGSNLYLQPYAPIPQGLLREHLEKLMAACSQASLMKSALFEKFDLYKDNQMKDRPFIAQSAQFDSGDGSMIAFYTLPGEDRTTICEQVEEIAANALGQDLDLYSFFYREPWFEPSFISPDFPTVRMMADSIKRITGKTARINTISKQDVFILNNHAKIPSLSFGISATEGRGAHHQPDECVEIEKLWQACQIVFQTVCTWLNGQPAYE
jgi:acetylornithine deacetylase/succinyl-diaminopimelate desuccinylase-like protein